MNELVEEIQFNVKIPLIEKQVFVERLKDQKNLETFGDADLKKLVREILKQNKDVPKPEFPEVYHLLDEMADKLYLFISREEIQRLKKLGIMGQ